MVRTALRSAALTVLLAAAASAAPAEGSGIVQGKDVAGRLIRIDGAIFAVSPTANLRWADGTALTLGSLPAPPELAHPEGLWPLLRATWSGQTSAAGTVIDDLVIEPTHD